MEPASDDLEFEPQLAAEIESVVEHLNDGHSDTVLLLARFAGERPDLSDAEIARIDRSAIWLRVRGGERAAGDLRLPFSGRPDTLLAARAQLFGWIHKARSLAGDGVPLTSLERELAETGRLSTFVSAVERIEDLTPGLRQITVRGGFDGFQPLGPDQFLYLMVDRPGSESRAIVPGFRMQDLQRLPETDRPASAYYTIREWDAKRGSIRLWIVLHDHGGVSDWARRAQPGDRVALWGPRSSFAPPADTRRLLLVGDETALPAIASILDQLDPDASAEVVVETIDPTHVVALSQRSNVSTRWIFRGAEEAGSGSRLLDAVRALPLDERGLYAFGAAEHRQIGAIRRFLRQERGLPASHVRMTAYWRRAPQPAGTRS